MELIFIRDLREGQLYQGIIESLEIIYYFLVIVNNKIIVQFTAQMVNGGKIETLEGEQLNSARTIFEEVFLDI